VAPFADYKSDGVFGSTEAFYKQFVAREKKDRTM
jgi:hypothetical protein